MPYAPPRVCSCGNIVPHGVQCACQKQRDAERKRAFDRKRPSARARGYDASWEVARREYLSANPICARCGQPANVVDHIQPHRGNQKLFWSKANWQALCARCHNSHKQSEERRNAERT